MKRIADKTPTKPVTKKVVKAKAPSKTDLQKRVTTLEGQLEQSLRDMIAYRDKYQKLRNRLERGLSLWDHVTILFGVSTIVDEIEIE